MIRGTTPTFTFTIKNKNVDLTQAQTIIVSLTQGCREIEKTGEDLTVTEHAIEVWLTQKESLSLSEGSSCEVQINWTYLDPDGETVRRAATRVRSIPISKQLLMREIS